MPYTQPSVKAVSSSLLPPPVAGMLADYIKHPAAFTVTSKLYTINNMAAFPAKTSTRKLQLANFQKKVQKSADMVVEHLLVKLHTLICQQPSLRQIAEAAFAVDVLTQLHFDTILFQHVISKQVCDPEVYQTTLKALYNILEKAEESPDLISMMRWLYLHPAESLFHRLFPNIKRCGPNPMQQDVIAILRNLVMSHRVLTLRDYPGSGKTTCLIALASLYHNIPRAPAIVFTCPIGAVIDELTVALTTLKIPLVTLVARYNVHNKLIRVEPQLGTTSWQLRGAVFNRPSRGMLQTARVILLTPDALLHICEDLPSQCTLFYDEAYADGNEEIVEAVTIVHPWRDVVIASATLPSFSLPQYTLHSIANTIPEIECESACIPGCTSPDEVQKLRQRLKESIFSRYFTRHDVVILRDALKLPRLPLSLHHVQPRGVLPAWDETLEVIQTLPDAEITHLFSLISRSDDIIPLVRLGRDGFYSFRHTHGIVYGVHNAVAAAVTVANGILPPQEQVILVQRILLQHDHVEATAEKKASRLGADLDKIKNERCLSNVAQTLERQSDRIHAGKCVMFPAHLMVGTSSHRRSCCDEKGNDVLDIEEDVITILQDLAGFKVPSYIIFLMLCRIGVHSQDLPDGLNALTRDLFASRQLRLVIGDVTLAYGVNLPITEVMLDGSCEYTPATLLQYLGRAGRRGLSDSATVYLSPHLQQMMHQLMLA